MSAEQNKQIDSGSEKKIKQGILVHDITEKIKSDGRFKLTVLASHEQEAGNTGVMVKPIIVFPTNPIGLEDTNKIVDDFKDQFNLDPRMNGILSNRASPTAFDYDFVGGLTLNPSSDNFEKIRILIFPNKISAYETMERYSNGQTQEFDVIFSEKFKKRRAAYEKKQKKMASRAKI